MYWWKIIIRWAFNEKNYYYVKAEDHWDLFAYVGYIHATNILKIEYMGYKRVSEEDVMKDKEHIMDDPKRRFQGIE